MPFTAGMLSRGHALMAADARPFRIAVAGGGIGGLAFAHLLKVRASGSGCSDLVDVSIFERDTSADARVQGYFLGLQNNSVALLKEGLPSAVELHADIARNSFSGMAMRGPRNGDWMVAPGKGAYVDRCMLRKGLLAGLEDCITWGARFSKYTEDANSSVVKAEFCLPDATVISNDYDLLVGADGARSAVRAQRAPGLVYADQGITNVAGIVAAAVGPAWAGEAVARAGGLVRWLGAHGHTVMCLPFTPTEGRAASGWNNSRGSSAHDSVLLWVLSYPGQRADWEGKFTGANDVTEDEYSESSAKRAELIADCAARVRKAGLPAELAELIEATPASSELYGPRQIYSIDPSSIIPGLEKQANRPQRVLVIGDAAHASTTHRGLGANIALRDASDLAEAVLCCARAKAGLELGKTDTKVDGKDFVCATLRRCEDTILQRGAQKAAASVQSTQLIHADGFFAHWLRPGMVKLFGYLMALGVVPVDS